MSAPPPALAPGCPACGVPLDARPRSGRLLEIVAGLPAAAELRMPRPRSHLARHRASRILDEDAADAEPTP